MLTLDHVSYAIGNKTIFNDASAELIDHEITCLIGPNGIGKSTLFNLITQSIQPESGQIIGIPDKIALLAQKNELFEPLTVRELLTIQRDTLDEEVLNLLQLKQLLDRPIEKLSGGQRQLVWLGYVLHQEPDLLLLDEPTTYLDLYYQQIFLKALTTLQAQRGFTVLMILHDLTQAFSNSQNIWLIDANKQLITGSVTELMDERLLSETFKLPLSIVEHAGQRLIIPEL
ncbi:ABC transporter ATP-binding protein [Weissella viridescens]|uniref:ABC transporter ATP-binding protein n=1 Tax=Weissella viridescens TaxID=1629 RepID=UPI0040562489